MRGFARRPRVPGWGYWRYLVVDLVAAVSKLGRRCWKAGRAAVRGLRAVPADERRRGLAGAATLLLVAVLAGGGAAGSGRVDRVGRAVLAGPGIGPRSHPAAAPTPPPPPVLAADRAAGAEPNPAAVAAALAGPLGSGALGGRVSASVVDLATGTVLLDHGGHRLATPASTTKLTTTAAVLSVLSPEHRITTTVVAGAQPGQVVLVGAGDPTLSAAASGTPTAYPGAARLSDLAAQVADWAKRSGTRISQVGVDSSAFTGPGVQPTWDPTDVAGGYVAPIRALMADGGRQRPDRDTRSAQPDIDAARAFAAFLGLPPAAVVSGRAPSGAPVLAAVRSAPLVRIIEQMLAVSDNVLAECLARQVAIAGGAPASFAGAADAVRRVLRGLGVDITGEKLVDGSGLSPRDRVSPSL
ncbi:MAG TPA: D-alanyl-D-alanine carboxypeptidase, partial [Mycobacteriales bacterium]|nr:D-alanyl-D-alanine carboxypeptidase [Mycobacteriales bacterium]